MDRAAAIDAILGRAHRTLAESEDGFPHFADPETGRWTRTSEGDWTGGFWVGQLWLGATLLDDRRLEDAALAWARRLRPRVASDTIFRGFLFWYGAAMGSVLRGSEEARAIALDGAASLGRSFSPVLGLVPLGTSGEEASDVGSDQANIDGVPGGTPLLAWAGAETGDDSLRSMALRHAARHAEICVRLDSSVCQSAALDLTTGAVLRSYTHKGFSDSSTWTRAQAWAMIGFAQAAAIDAVQFSGIAARVADWWIEHLPADGVARWDFDDPDPGAPVDTSGTAIAAAALLHLAQLDPGRFGPYRTVAARMTDALIDGHLTAGGILRGGCYNRRIGLATSNELVWGDYYLLESLAALEGRLPTARL